MRDVLRLAREAVLDCWAAVDDADLDDEVREGVTECLVDAEDALTSALAYLRKDQD